MTSSLLVRYGGPVPRYTSYPTAPHFHGGITQSDYRNWLSELTTEDQMSLYLHVPYCQEMCWYCGCQTKVTKRYQPISDYAKHLALEIDLVGKQIKPRLTVDHIHWGGGTPTLLQSPDFLTLMNRLKTQFKLSRDAEVAIEIDPRSMTPEKATALAEAGVTRASLGVQDFNPHVQMAINRIQSFDQTKRVVEWLRESGINQISLDLMYGLPKQTLENALHTVELTMELNVDRYSVFGYAHVPWMKSHQKLINDADLPNANDRSDQANAIANKLKHYGYVTIGLDHFARPEDAMAQALNKGKLHRNFQGYTTDSAPSLLGFGASAIGSLKQGYVQNQSSVRQYSSAIARGELPIAHGFKLSDSDRLRRHIIERLMCDYAVDLRALIKEANARMDHFAIEMTRLNEMQRDGLVTWQSDLLMITPKGRPFVRAICAVFDAYLGNGAGRHSRAV